MEEFIDENKGTTGSNRSAGRSRSTRWRATTPRSVGQPVDYAGAR